MNQHYVRATMIIIGLVMLLGLGIYLQRSAPFGNLDGTSVHLGASPKAVPLPHPKLKPQTPSTPSADNSQSPQTTVTTTGNCTKTVTTKSSQTAAGTTSISSTSVNCSNQGPNSTHVSINSDNNQASGSGGATSNNANTDIHITN